MTTHQLVQVDPGTRQPFAGVSPAKAKRRRFAPCMSGADARPPHSAEASKVQDSAQRYAKVTAYERGADMNKTSPKQDAPAEAITKRPKVVRKTSLELPEYVWEAAREYLNDKPDMRFRNLVMAGFRALGLEIADEDLIAERKKGPAG